MNVDHVIPVSKGGTDDPDNLVSACPACNVSKGSKTLDEWKNRHKHEEDKKLEDDILDFESKQNEETIHLYEPDELVDDRDFYNSEDIDTELANYIVYEESYMRRNGGQKPPNRSAARR